MRNKKVAKLVRVAVLLWMAYQTDRMYEAMFRKQYGIDERERAMKEYRTHVNGK